MPELKTRIIVSASLLPILVAVLLAPPIFGGILIGLLGAVAAYELLWNTALVKHPRLVAYTMAFAVAQGVWTALGSAQVWGLAGVICFAGLLFMELLLARTKLSFEKTTVCLFAGLLIPYFLCAVVRIRMMPMGMALVLMPFLQCFMSDTGGYFIGVFWGKHKLCPTVSPKKTVEGLLGGMVFAVGGTLLFGLVMSLCCGYRVNFFYAILYGVVGSLASLVGDLTYSVVKRQTGIKDFGKILPGHGGVLDRFDSTTFVAPVMELMLVVLPIMEIVNG